MHNDYAVDSGTSTQCLSCWLQRTHWLLVKIPQTKQKKCKRSKDHKRLQKHVRSNYVKKIGESKACQLGNDWK